jgi:hypothetical protein
MKEVFGAMLPTPGCQNPTSTSTKAPFSL